MQFVPSWRPNISHMASIKHVQMENAELIPPLVCPAADYQTDTTKHGPAEPAGVSAQAINVHLPYTYHAGPRVHHRGTKK